MERLIELQGIYYACKYKYDELNTFKSFFEMEDESFKTIIRLGKQMVPFIMDDIMTNDADWFPLICLSTLFPHDKIILTKSAGHLDEIVKDCITWWNRTSLDKAQLIYKKGDLFDHITGKELIVHACNGQGVWGSGFAAQLKKRYPEAFTEFAEHLELYKKRYNPHGWNYVYQPSDQRKPSIGNIVTSNGYGKYKDQPYVIIMNTSVAIGCMLQSYAHDEPVIVSPKINAGLFEVPWKDTEKAICQAIEMSGLNVTWTIYEL